MVTMITILQFALQHWRSRMKKEKSVEEKFRERPLVLRKRREKLKATANWPLFYYKFNRDHALPNLIWNYKVSVLKGEINSIFLP